MLSRVGLLTPEECQQIVLGLSEIQAEIEREDFPFVLEREDVHMHIEAALIEKLGDVGRKFTRRGAATTRSPPILNSGSVTRWTGSTRGLSVCSVLSSPRRSGTVG